MDRFLEEVVKKRSRTMDEVMYFISLVMMVVFAILALMNLMALPMGGFNLVDIFFTLLFGGMAVYLYFFRDRLRTEYEYTFTNGSIDFAMVFNNRKRKSLGSLNVAKVDAFGRRP